MTCRSTRVGRPRGAPQSMDGGEAAASSSSDDLPDGLTLFPSVVAPAEQQALLAAIDEFCAAGAAGQLRGKSYEAPPVEWQRTGQGRVALLFGAHVKCNKVDNAQVEPMPDLFERLLGVFESTGILSAEERPDTCCVNVYEKGSWLPPHVDSEAFDRPFCTLSLLSTQDVVFGQAIGGERGAWTGPCRLAMPPGSVLRLSGEAAGPAWKHALPCATERRVSLTFRRLSAERWAAFEQVKQASAEAAAARRERRLAAKEARGWRPLPTPCLLP